jgi:hypothetical protein
MRRFRWVLAGLAVAIVSVAVVVVGRAMTSSDDTAAAPAVGTEIPINGSVGSVFSPSRTGLSADVAAEPGDLTPLDAYDKALGTSMDSLPDGASVMTGYFTLPLGPGAPGQYTADDELVYAVTWPNCAPDLGTVRFDGKPDPTPSSRPCHAWAFIVPSTGALVNLTWSYN